MKNLSLQTESSMAWSRLFPWMKQPAYHPLMGRFLGIYGYDLYNAHVVKSASSVCLSDLHIKLEGDL
jgi:hypothetical protein